MTAEELKDAIAAWIEHFIHQEASFKPGQSLTPERLNELFNLLIVQGDSANLVLTYIRDFLPQYMVDIGEEIDNDVTTALNAWITAKNTEINNTVNTAVTAANTATTNANAAKAAADTATTNANAATSAANTAKTAADTATANANAATTAANASKAAADTATTNATNATTAANTAKTNADTATAAANTATTAANTAKTAANIATINANTAATTADNATINANAAKTSANAAAVSANNATNAANAATTSANTAATNANEAAASIGTAMSSLYAETATGTGTAITVVTLPFTNGYIKTITPIANNAGAATTVNGKPLYKPNTTTAPTVTAGKAITIIYNTSGDCFFIKASAEGDAVAANVLAGKTFTNENDTGIIGTMPQYTGTITPWAINADPGNLYANINKGYYADQYPIVKLSDPDFIAANFLATKNMFGMDGSIPVLTPDVANEYPALQISGVDGGGNVFFRIPENSYTNNAYWIRGNDPDFIPSNFLATKTIFGLQGSIPNRDYAWHAPVVINAYNGGIGVVPPVGYFAGNTDYNNHGGVDIPSTDFIASNILTGKSPFGLAGTAKRVATGTVTASSTVLSFTNVDGTIQNRYYVSVSGLTFTPSKIIVHRSNGTYDYYTTYINNGGAYAKLITMHLAGPSTGSAQSGIKGDVGSASVSSTGFVLPVQDNTVTYDWTAIE